MSVWLNGDTQGGTPSYPLDADPLSEPLIKTKLSQLAEPEPSKTFVFMEENEESIDDGMMVVENPKYGPWNSWWDMPSDRHDGFGVVSFADLHVEPVKWLYPKKFKNHGQSVASDPRQLDARDFQRAQGWVPVR